METGNLEKISLQKEFWRSFAYQILRYLLFTFGTFLTTHNVIDDKTAEGLTSRTVIEFVIGLALMAFTTAWQSRRTWFNVIFPRAAHKALPDVPLAVIKNDVLTNSKSGTSSV